MAEPKLSDLGEVRWQGIEIERPDRLELHVRGARGPHEVRLVRVDQPVGVGTNRREDRVLLEAQGGVPRSGERQQVGDRLVSLGVGNRMRPALGNGELDAGACRDIGNEPRAVKPARTHLEVGIARP